MSVKMKEGAKMFKDQDFDVFLDETLDGRMDKIRNIIDPEFMEFAQTTLPILEQDGQKWYAHVAKHLRRTVYAPDSTWIAFAPNKRGYKMVPHFELTIWDDNIFLSLSMLENLKTSQSARDEWTAKLQKVAKDYKKLPAEFVLSPDHMENQVQSLEIESAIQHYHDVKKAELIVGLQIKRGDARIGTAQLNQDLLAALKMLLPIYEKLK